MSIGISYALANVEGMSLEQVDAILSEGGRFVVFEFAVSFVMFTISRPSKVWLVRSAEDAQRAAKRYTIITMLFGWWALPFGPQRTWRVLKVNRGGGTDVTSDVRGALTEETVKLGVVRFEEETDLYQMFDHVDGSDLRELRNCLSPLLASYADIDAAWAGRIANEWLPPMHLPYAICLEKHEGIDEAFIDAARTALRKSFPKWVKFEFIDMLDPEISVWVVKQCDAIYLREK